MQTRGSRHAIPDSPGSWEIKISRALLPTLRADREMSRLARPALQNRAVSAHVGGESNVRLGRVNKRHSLAARRTNRRQFSRLLRHRTRPGTVARVSISFTVAPCHVLSVR